MMRERCWDLCGRKAALNGSVAEKEEGRRGIRRGYGGAIQRNGRVLSLNG